MEARIVWSSAVDPAVLELAGEPGGGPDSIDFRLFGDRLTLLRDHLGEHVAIEAEGRQLRLDITAGSLLDGPVVPHFHLTGITAVQRKLATLHDLMQLCRGARLGYSRTIDARLPRLVDGLRVLDALADGATLREIAGIVNPNNYGWPGDGEYVKSRVRRLVVLARRLEQLGPRGVMAKLT